MQLTLACIAGKRPLVNLDIVKLGVNRIKLAAEACKRLRIADVAVACGLELGFDLVDGLISVADLYVKHSLELARIIAVVVVGAERKSCLGQYFLCGIAIVRVTLRRTVVHVVARAVVITRN